MTFFELEFALEGDYAASCAQVNVQPRNGSQLLCLLNAAMADGVQTIGESSVFALVDHVHTQIRTGSYNPSALVPCVSCNRV